MFFGLFSGGSVFGSVFFLDTISETSQIRQVEQVLAITADVSIQHIIHRTSCQGIIGSHDS